ncbi:MAG: FG-GAP-like repeat-containing protein [Bacteroidota bacterium]
MQKEYIILGLFLSISTTLLGQVFQKMTVRDLAKMRNNYGTAVADYDQDGDLDIFMVAYDGLERGKPETWSRLLENRGSGWFEDATAKAGFDKQYSSTQIKDNKLGAAWGDYDNDGFPDLLLTHAGHIQLYHNEQDGTFEDVTETAQIAPCLPCVNTSGLWWDFDNDGDLDFYISDYRTANRLFQNQGDGTFQEVGVAMKVDDARATWSSLAMDINQDGWQDLYVINDYGFSHFYLNQNGESFVEATSEYGLRNTGSGMGATVGDYNNDGFFDIYITNISEFQPNKLFQGTQNHRFKEAQMAEGVGYANWAWGTQFFDADHDGDEDLLVVNGFESLTYSNKFFKNRHVEGKTGFEDISQRATLDGDAHGMAAEVFDYDEDGDLDILVANTNDSPSLYQNVGRAANTNWLQVKLEGTSSNRNAFGAVVIATGDGQTIKRYHHGAGIMGQSIKPVHFGLGAMKKIDTLTVIWPNQHTEYFYDIPANQTINITETPLTTSVFAPKNFATSAIELQRVSPNPFRAQVELSISTHQKGLIVFQVFNSLGQLVFQEREGVLPAGEHSLVWDATNTAISSGIYYYRIVLSEHVLSGKLLRE